MLFAPLHWDLVCTIGSQRRQHHSSSGRPAPAQAGCPGSLGEEEETMGLSGIMGMTTNRMPGRAAFYGMAVTQRTAMESECGGV